MNDETYVIEEFLQVVPLPGWTVVAYFGANAGPPDLKMAGPVPLVGVAQVRHHRYDATTDEYIGVDPVERLLTWEPVVWDEGSLILAEKLIEFYGADYIVPLTPGQEPASATEFFHQPTPAEAEREALEELTGWCRHFSGRGVAALTAIVRDALHAHGLYELPATSDVAEPEEE